MTDDTSRTAAEAALVRDTVLEVLAGRRPFPGDAAFRAALERVVSGWGEQLCYRSDDRRCPDCGSGFVHEYDAGKHAVACPGHAGAQRLEAVRMTLGLLGRPAVAPLQTPLEAEVRPPHVAPHEARAAVALVGSGRAPGREAGEAYARASEKLLRVVTEWQHFVERESDPCPWCRATMPVKAFGVHVRSCEQHPAAVLARATLTQEAVPEAVFRLVHEWVRSRHELAQLSGASERFSADQGWSGEAATSDKWSERPWRAAIEQARSFLAARKVERVGRLVAAAGAPFEPMGEQIERLHTALENLAEACTAYWNRMGEGERGKSLAYPESEGLWVPQREAAKALLGRITAPATAVVPPPLPVGASRV